MARRKNNSTHASDEMKKVVRISSRPVHFAFAGLRDIGRFCMGWNLECRPRTTASIYETIFVVIINPSFTQFSVFVSFAFPRSITRIGYTISGFAGRRSAFYKYINSLKQINKVFLKPYLNFANIILKLYRYKSKPQDATYLNQLKEEIDELRIVERIWLNDKLGDLGEGV